MTISASDWGAQHPNTGWNIQQFVAFNSYQSQTQMLYNFCYIKQRGKNNNSLIQFILLFNYNVKMLCFTEYTDKLSLKIQILLKFDY